MIRSLVLAALCLTFATEASARDRSTRGTRWGTDVATVGATLGGQLLGATAGVLVGNALVANSGCAANGELGCEFSVLAVMATGVVGSGIGGTIAAPIGHAAAGGRRPLTVLAFTGGTTATGVGIAGLGVATDSSPLLATGAAVYLGGPSIAAGAGSYVARRQAARIGLTADLRPGFRGVRLTGTF